MAIANVSDSKGTERVAFINAAARYYDMHIKLLQDAGVLPKAAARLEHTAPEGKPFTLPQQQSHHTEQYIVGIGYKDAVEGDSTERLLDDVVKRQSEIIR